MSATELRAALLAANGGFRQEPIALGVLAAVVREPSAGDWQFAGVKAREWLGLAPDADQVDVVEAAKGEAGRGLDAAFVVRVLFDKSGTPVFSDVDADALRAQWGPEYARVVSRALQLANLDSRTPVADAKNDLPETQAVSS